MASLDKSTAKYRIVDCFLELLETRPYRKITVNDLVDEIDINRKTFYYHFYGKSDLVRFIFRSTLADYLRGHFAASKLIAETHVVDDKYHDMPFFVEPDEGFSQGRFFECFGNFFMENRDFYCKINLEESQVNFRRYLATIYKPALRHDIRAMTDVHHLKINNDVLNWLAMYYTNASVLLIHDCSVSSPKTVPPSLMNGFYNLIYDSILNSLMSMGSGVANSTASFPTNRG